MMDFLDPKKSHAHTVRLIVGYVLIGIALVLATVLLLDVASGFGVKEGKVIQNGLVFLSSSPGGATIMVNGQNYNNEKTNVRLILPSSTYTLRLTREGYRDWQRALTVEGGSVEHFDYPLLIPKQLTPAAVSGYPSAPSLATVSPDRRWLVVQPAGQVTGFDVYNLRDPKQVLASKTTVSLPTSVFSLAPKAGQSLELVEWSRDNDHVLLKHIVGSQLEYVILSRAKPETSFNLTKKLQLSATATVSLLDKKFDRYMIHDTANGSLAQASFDTPTPVAVLNDVLQYKTYGQDVIVYATATGAPDGKVLVKLYQNKKIYTVRQVAKADQYLLDITTYDGDWYVAAGTPPEDHVYIYRNIADHLDRDSKLPLVPVDILKLNNPNYLEFSANSQFALIENGQDIATYDVENDRSYTYHTDRPIDAPQKHVGWMDGYHISFMSDKTVVLFDYDGTNVQTLTAASSEYLPFFDTAYQNLYTIAPAGAGANTTSTAHSIFQTPLLTAADR